MSTLDQMQAFVTVVEEGSFTAAALQFDISPTAMCKKVAVLEKSLSTRLLIRTPRLITMTDIGKKILCSILIKSQFSLPTATGRI
jgi:DNA-binding transcriptional LysR family regulator